MNDRSLLSGEQALDDYFAALLDESPEVIESEETASAVSDSEQAKEELAASDEEDSQGIETIHYELEPMAQTVAENTYAIPDTVEFDVPNLEDVERLLKQLESSNPVEELHLEEVMEQNTVDIATQPEVAVEEEIQDWSVDVPVEPEVELQTQEVTAVADEEIEAVAEQEPVSTPELQVDIEPETQSGGSDIGTWESTQRNEVFQALYFDVNGVTFAVPLDELGGIHQIGELNHLIGRPSWYLGLQTSREAQLDVVDTAKWVMPEKLSDDSYKEEYQYIVMLGESMWGLASTKLLGTESLEPTMVRWRETAGKRPWLAGMVKEKMCALVHVEALIAMLNAGLDVKALDK